MDWLDQLEIDAAYGVASNWDATYWADYRPLVDALPVHRFPTSQDLNHLLPEGLCSAGGQAIRFVNSTELEAEDYEHRIFTKGFVSTRSESWHDLFNALVWMRFPHIKTAMNALHYQAEPESTGRGRLRDALTLFDECGVLLVSADEGLLEAAANRDWQHLFQSHTSQWHKDFKTAICGHAILEKLIAPYKSMTAKALLIKVSPQAMLLPQNDLLTLLDKELARQALAGWVLNQPAQLSPLPLAGIPGWDFAGLQNQDFYNDTDVFRPPAKDFTAAPILELDI